jgi:hypothetical protein
MQWNIVLGTVLFSLAHWIQKDGLTVEKSASHEESSAAILKADARQFQPRGMALSFHLYVRIPPIALSLFNTELNNGRGSCKHFCVLSF